MGVAARGIGPRERLVVTYLRTRPCAPETFTCPEPVRVSGLEDEDAPQTERRPELAAAWAAAMTTYREAKP